VCHSHYFAHHSVEETLKAQCESRGLVLSSFIPKSRTGETIPLDIKLAAVPNRIIVLVANSDSHRNDTVVDECTCTLPFPLLCLCPFPFTYPFHFSSFLP
jgi:hypothetical protein